MNTQAGLQIPKCGEGQLILCEWFLTRIICQPNVDFWWTWVLHCRPPRICLLFTVQSSHMVIWADVGVGLEISPKLKTVRNPSGSNWEKSKTTNFSSSGPPWIHPGGYLTACDIYCEGSLTQDQGSPSQWPSEKSHKLVNYLSTTSASLQTNFLWAPSDWKQWYRRME